jgi:multiple sugar transport system substrate-binding protein
MEIDKDVAVELTATGPSRKDFIRTAGIAAAGAAAAVAGVPQVARAASVQVGRDLSPISLTVYRGTVTTGHDWNADIFAKFEKQNPNITVKSLFAPLSTTDEHGLVVSQLAAGSSAVDIYSGDVIWPPEFAAAGWILPIDKYIDDAFRNDLLPGPKLGCTVNGKLYAFPFFTDAGVLYYRTDLLAKYKLSPPQTYMDLITAAQTVTKHEPSVPYGMLWQGAQYEGLFCDICELIWSNGGNILENFTGPKVVVNSPQNQVAVQFMVDTIQKYKIAPLAVTTYKEEDTRHLFQNGKSVFMRNWPYVWTNGNDPKQSSIVGKFQLKTTVKGPSGKVGASCLGGWNMFINAKSNHPDEAAKLALFITSFESQKYLSINAGNSPTRSSVYKDPDVLKKNPWYAHFYDVIRSALPRPVSKYETKISDRFTRQINAALLGQVSVSTALANAQRDIEALVGNSNQP